MQMVSGQADRNRTNPFTGPIVSLVNRIRGISWEMPFLPQIIQVVVQSLVLVVFCFLYCSIGIVFNCHSIFVTLLVGTRADFRNSNDFVGKSAYALMAGIYLILEAPCWLIVMPFMLLGWLWDHMSYGGLVVYVSLIGLLVVAVLKLDTIIKYFIP